MEFVDPRPRRARIGTTRVVAGPCGHRARQHLALELLADSERWWSLEFVELNPVIVRHNKTLMLGVEMLLSGLRERLCSKHRRAKLKHCLTYRGTDDHEKTRLRVERYCFGRRTFRRTRSFPCSEPGLGEARRSIRI